MVSAATHDVACNRYTTHTGPRTVLKRSGAEDGVDAGKAVHSMVAAGCPERLAGKIAAELPDGSTEDIRDHITAEMLRRGAVDTASRYRAYSAGFTLAAVHVMEQGQLAPYLAVYALQLAVGLGVGHLGQ